MSKKSDRTRSVIKVPPEKQNETVSEPSVSHSEDIKAVVITINYLRNIMPLYSISDIKVSLNYLNQNVGESQVIPVTDSDKLSLNESFEIEVDVNSPKQLDQLASNPVNVITIQSSGTLDAALYEQLQTAQGSKHHVQPAEEVDSLFSMYEIITGDKQFREELQQQAAKKKKKKGKKDNDKSNKSNQSQTSKSSKRSATKKSSKSSGKTRSKSRAEVPVIKSEIYGMCVIDLIPLFLGKTSYSETLLIQPVKRTCQILSTFKNFPELSITVETKNKTTLVNVQNILNFTVESICNVPELMVTDMDCKICAMLPLENHSASPVIFHNPKITNKVPGDQIPKRWPGIHDIGYNSNTTKYFIDTNLDGITNKAHLDLQQAFQEEETRIEYNYLKRNIVFKNGNKNFAAYCQTYKKLALEIFLIPKSKKHDTVTSDQPTHSKLKGTKSPPHLHLMAVFDIVSLLYPGVTRLHVAAPVTTFTFEEAAKAGLHDSFFMPNPKSDLADKPSKSKLDTSKKKKEKKEKLSKKDKATSMVEDKNLASQLPSKPEEPPPPDPSVPVFNEEGKPCFIIIELELLTPLLPKQDIKDLQADLYQLQMGALQTSKTIINRKVADDFHNQAIREIIDDLNKNWIKYKEEINTIPSAKHGDFLEYLQKSGAYQTYLSSIVTSATLLITNKYKCKESYFKNSKTYQNLVSEVFTDLISQMHAVLNSLACSGMKPLEEKYTTPSEVSFFYAKEAAELKLYPLADRYFMERIINDDSYNADFWFDYAVYNIEVNDTEKAFECIRESLAMSCTNKYTLLLFGILLAEKGNMQDAEICLLNLMILESRWLEGWSILYLFYQKWGRLDGMEMAMDTAKKLDENVVIDYFSEFDDLAWSWRHIPKTLSFKTAILLLKMRLYSWAELALAEEVLVPKYYGYANYLLAVASYYKKDFNHALEHIAEAKEYLGADFGILELSGHALLGNGKLNEAKEQYFHLIESFDIPKDIHVVYLNCADILTKLGDHEKARKMILVACKNHQTPHVWFSAGRAYYRQNDILSAEECFNEANMKDNRHAEVWGYLTLVNLKLHRLHEAEQCYQQAMQSNLNNEALSASIKEEFQKATSLY